MASEALLPLEEFGMQTCRKCGVTFPLSEFPKLHTMRPGVRTSCKKCYSRYSREWNVNNADRYFDGHLRRRFGITLAEYNAILERQGGVCAICGSPPTRRNRRKGGQRVFVARLVADHDHVTGKVRGLLCSNCNTGLGAAMVRRALEYLECGLWPRTTYQYA